MCPFEAALIETVGTVGEAGLIEAAGTVGEAGLIETAGTVGEVAAEGAENLAEGAAATGTDLPLDFSLPELDLSDLPNDLSLPEPDLSNLPDDLSLPELDLSDLPNDLGLPESDLSDLPDDLSLPEPDLSDLPDDPGTPEPTSADLPDDSIRDAEGDRSKKKEAENPEKKMEPPVEITFKCPDGCDKAEYNRQVKGQQEGLNQMSIDEFLRNRENYKQNGRDTREGAAAQDRARAEARAEKVDEFRKQGMSRKEAEAKADEWLDTQDALHNPDQVAGGNPKDVNGVGDSRVNSSIGAQWGKGRADELEKQVRDYVEANNIPAEDLGKIKLNVQLNVE